MFGYATDLRSATQGRATYTMQFDHYEAVVIIYAIQTTFVLLALQMKYDSDGAILAVYSGICGVLFLYLFVATRLAKEKSLHSYRTVINTNAGAGQTVYHMHIHVLGGRMFRWPPG
mgnify:CR=1 FL=1